MSAADAFDVVVVGAGPAGSLAATFAAREGARTLLVDRREEIGHPVQCGEFLPAPEELADLFDCRDVIDEAFRIPQESVLRETRSMACVAPSGRRYTFPLHGFQVSRRSFDKALSLRAQAEGAELRFPTTVSRVHDDQVEFVGGERVRARVVIGADGPLSTVARSAGFATPRELYRMITASVEGSFPPQVDLYFGRIAPGGYAWVFPKLEGANVGLGVTRVPPWETLSSLLDRFLHGNGYPVATDRTRWWVPLGAPPESAVRDRSLFCGDAANLVMATNGGGIPTAMLSGRDAGVVAGQHVRTGVPLTEYDRLWKRHLYVPLERAHRIKRLGDRFLNRDAWASLGMRYIGAAGLDAAMRLRWPARIPRLA